eukprot:scaffold20549_cov53-Phaeocystis_antarctica.AAC.1
MRPGTSSLRSVARVLPGDGKSNGPCSSGPYARSGAARPVSRAVAACGVSAAATAATASCSAARRGSAGSLQRGVPARSACGVEPRSAGPGLTLAAAQ